MEYWIRSEECKEVKSVHLEYIDDHYTSRETFIEDTVFSHPETRACQDPVLEPNMFPYETPPGVEHWTLWSRRDMTEAEVEDFVGRWCAKHRPDVVCWNYDDNAGDRSILWFHVHVYLRVAERWRNLATEAAAAAGKAGKGRFRSLPWAREFGGEPCGCGCGLEVRRIASQTSRRREEEDERSDANGTAE